MHLLLSLAAFGLLSTTTVCFRMSRFAKLPTRLWQDAARDVIISNSKDVKEVTDLMIKTLSNRMSTKLQENDTRQSVDAQRESFENLLTDQYKKLIADVKETSLTDLEKALVIAEVDLTIADVRQSTDNLMSLNDAKKKTINIPIFKTTSFSEASAPYLVCYGPGKVGQSVSVDVVTAHPLITVDTPLPYLDPHLGDRL